MSVLRTIGCLFLVLLCGYSGLHKIQSPAAYVQMVQKGNLPTLIQQLQIGKHVPGFKWTDKEATILVQAVGGLMVTTSLMIVVNLARGFNALVLASILAVITVCQHVDIKDPKKTSIEQQIQAFKNIGLIGGLLICASGFNDGERKQNK